MASDSRCSEKFRKRKKILNDVIFELNDSDRGTPSPVSTEISNNHIIISEVIESDITSQIESTISQSSESSDKNVTEFKVIDSVESGEIDNEESNDNVDDLRNENQILKDEIETLKSQQCSCTAIIEGPEPRKPLFSIKFRDKDVADTYKECLIKSINKLLKCKADNGDLSDLEVNVWEDENFTNEIDNEVNTFDDLFIVDSDPLLSKSDYIPYYSNVKEIDNETKNEEVKASSNNCFNCGDYHQLRDCPKPRNHERINSARNKHKQMSGGKNARYHLEDDTKFAHLKPGIVSDNLRRALGLHRYEVPHFIYRMRLLGYPPGWWEEAKDSNSGLKMFTEEDVQNKVEVISNDMIHEYPGFNVPLSSKMKEECWRYKYPPMQYSQRKDMLLQSIQEPPCKKIKLDVPLPSDANLAQSDMEVDDIIDDNARTVDQTVTILNYNMVFQQPVIPGTELNPPLPPPLPKDVLPCPPPLPSSSPKPLPPIDISDNDNSVTNPVDLTIMEETCKSPSLLELEFQKRQLLSELQDSSNSNTPNMTPTHSHIETDPAKINDNSKKDKNTAEQNEKTSENKLDDSVSNIDKNNSLLENCSLISENSEIPATPDKNNYSLISDSSLLSTPKPGIVKSVSHGTPLLKNISPYTTTPDQSKFAKDMGPIINFENLPDSTGKYEQMKGVLKKVHNIVKQTYEK